MVRREAFISVFHFSAVSCSPLETANFLKLLRASTNCFLSVSKLFRAL